MSTRTLTTLDIVPVVPQPDSEVDGYEGYFEIDPFEPERGKCHYWKTWIRNASLFGLAIDDMPATQAFESGCPLGEVGTVLPDGRVVASIDVKPADSMTNEEAVRYMPELATPLFTVLDSEPRIFALGSIGLACQYHEIDADNPWCWFADYTLPVHSDVMTAPTEEVKL